MAENNGILSTLLSGTGSLIILVVITLVVVTTLLGANLLTRDTVVTDTVLNETDGYINATIYQLGTFNTSRSSYVITSAYNNTNNQLLLSGNYTVNSFGQVTNASTTNWNDSINFSYTFQWSAVATDQATVDRMEGNFTGGIDNISNKLPTILLLAIIIVLLGVLIILVRQSGIMTQVTGSGGSL